MSYARYRVGASDVYVYRDAISGFLVCSPGCYTATRPSEMLEHLLDEHVAKDELVPDYCLNRLKEEIERGDIGVDLVAAYAAILATYGPLTPELEENLLKIQEELRGEDDAV